MRENYSCYENIVSYTHYAIIISKQKQTKYPHKVYGLSLKILLQVQVEPTPSPVSLNRCKSALDLDS